MSCTIASSDGGVSSPRGLFPAYIEDDGRVKFDFPMAMGVRYGEREWKQTIESLIEKRKPEITQILRDYGVPLVEEESAAPAR